MVQVKPRLLLLSLFLLLVPVAAGADSQRVHALTVYVELEKDGTATVYEKWDVNTGDKITEWYLVRDNLGDITIDNFVVMADTVMLADDGEWNVNRNLEQKAGKYGIVHKSNGVELCWGVGSHGHHVFETLYSMHGAVKSLRDYDMLHLQLVSPGLSSPPEKVKVLIGSDLVQLDTTVARVWGFGYDGICIFDEGEVYMEADGPFGTEDSVIALLRLDKGILEPTSTRDQDFQEVLDRAMEGADFGTDKDDEDDARDGAVGLTVMGIIIYLWWRIKKKIKKRKEKPAYLIKKVLGVKENSIDWYRDIPFSGNLPAAKYVLGMVDGTYKWDAAPLSSALILRMVYNGYLDVTRLEEKNDTEIRFTDKEPGGLDSVSHGLYKMLKQAAGKNNILEKNEFSKWARENCSAVYAWSNSARSEGVRQLQAGGWEGRSTGTLSAAGKEEGKHLLGLKKFLKEFTLTNEREAFDANLWKEYMVYGSLLGIAKIVAKQFKEIAPQYGGNAEHIVNMSTDFSGIVRTAASLYASRNSYSSYSSSSSGHSYSSSSSRGGYGGRSSHSGGGGYSGGGRGGGGR